MIHREQTGPAYQLQKLPAKENGDSFGTTLLLREFLYPGYLFWPEKDAQGVLLLSQVIGIDRIGDYKIKAATPKKRICTTQALEKLPEQTKIALDFGKDRV